MSNEPLTSTLTALNVDPQTADYREQPNNVEAEQALLGALLVNNEALSRVGDYLLDTHFFQPVHGRIFGAAAKLIERGQIANPVTLKHFFEQDESLADVGGAQYLVRLAGAAVSVINVDHYGRTIYDLAMRRSLITIGEDLVNRAFEADIDDPAKSQLESAETQLFRLAESGRHEGGFQDFGSALTLAIEMADIALKSDGEVTGVATDLIDLDAKLGGLHPSDLVILAARPAMGKTSLATNIAFNAARNFRQEVDDAGNKTVLDGAVVGFFSLEMSAEQLATRILAEQAEIPSDRIRRGAIKMDDFSRLVTASQQLSELPLFIDDTPALSISALRTRARRLKRNQGLGLIVVDYLQLLRPSDRSENRVQEISEITQGLKALAKDLNVPVLALSQLSRAVEQREDKRPQLSDLRESGSIEQDADVVMFIYREEYYHERKQPEPDTPEHADWREKAERVHGLAEVIIGKQRHGPTGTVSLQFEREITKFQNLEPAERIPDAVF